MQFIIRLQVWFICGEQNVFQEYIIKLRLAVLFTCLTIYTLRFNLYDALHIILTYFYCEREYVYNSKLVPLNSLSSYSFKYLLYYSGVIFQVTPKLLYTFSNYIITIGMCSLLDIPIIALKQGKHRVKRQYLLFEYKILYSNFV